MGDRHLNRRITYDKVANDDVADDACDKVDAVGVPNGNVVDDDIVVGAGVDEADSEVTALRRVSVPTEPVRTEPVACCGAGQSYAAARVGLVTVSNGDIRHEFVTGSAGDKQS